MRAILSSGYVYRPRSAEIRQRQSIAERARRGIPSGHVQVYGVHVPETRADPLRSYAYEVARRWGSDKARAFVLTAAANDWEIEKPPFPIRLRKLGPPLPPREFVRIKRTQFVCRVIARLARHWYLQAEEEARERLRQARRAAIMEQTAMRAVSRFARHWHREIREEQRRAFRATCTVARFARHWGLAEEREQRMLLRVCRTVARFARHWERRQGIDWELVEELLSETANIGEVAQFLNVTESHVKNGLRKRHDQGLSAFGRRVRRA